AYQDDNSPFLRIRNSWEEFLASKPKKFRYKVRKRQEQLESNGRLELRPVTKTEDVELLFEEMLEIESKSWTARAGFDIPSSRRETEYYRRLLPYLASSGTLFAQVLRQQGRAIAYSLCCES